MLSILCQCTACSNVLAPCSTFKETLEHPVLLSSEDDTPAPTTAARAGACQDDPLLLSSGDDTPAPTTAARVGAAEAAPVVVEAESTGRPVRSAARRASPETRRSQRSTGRPEESSPPPPCNVAFAEDYV